MSVLKRNHFVGVDLVDGSCPSPRPVDIAFLDRSLGCEFAVWSFDSSGAGLLPDWMAPAKVIFAVDGPQGLAAQPGDRMRLCEKIVGVPGRCPYELPLAGPYAGFIRSSVRLFASLWQSDRWQVYGCPTPLVDQGILLEAYPGKAWRDLSRLTGAPLTANKRILEGRRQRLALLRALGLQLSPAVLPTHDQLDAALAAYTAYLFSHGKTIAQGVPPFWDPTASLVREGLIVLPGSNLDSRQ